MKQSMSEEPYEKWERDFRAAALADDFAIFRDHIRRLGLPDEPQLMLEGTICFLCGDSAYRGILDADEEARELLAMQTYNPADATGARYAFTFDLCGKAYARILVETTGQVGDLADLYGKRWWDYEVVGFRHLWISHPDWSSVAAEEKKQLQQEVIDDLLFDYGENEIEFWFDDSYDDWLSFDIHDSYKAQGDGGE